MSTRRGRSAAGTPFDHPFVHSWVVVDGLATSFTEFYDTVRMDAVLGLSGAIDIVSQPDIPAQVNLTQAGAPVTR